MNNADRIRNMDNHNLADFIYNMYQLGGKNALSPRLFTLDKLEEWLEEPEEPVENEIGDK